MHKHKAACLCSLLLTLSLSPTALLGNEDKLPAVFPVMFYDPCQGDQFNCVNLENSVILAESRLT